MIMMMLLFNKSVPHCILQGLASDRVHVRGFGEDGDGDHNDDDDYDNNDCVMLQCRPLPSTRPSL